MRLRIFGLNFGGMLAGVAVAAMVAGCGGGSSTQPTQPTTLTIGTTSPLAPGDVGTAYSASLAAAGGTPSYTWTLSGGTLPAGLSLAATGAISGTPTAAGTSTFTLKVSDSATSPQTATLAATLVISPALTITTTSPLPVGTINTAYSTTLAATGGTAPLSWTVTTGTLPVGLTLTSAGVLSGTPTAAGTGTFTLQVADAASAKQTLDATLVINAPLAITTTSIPAGTQGAAYNVQLAATGGSGSYTWTVDPSVPLPAGLSLASTGVLSGTPSGVASVMPDFIVTDTGSHTVSKSLALVVNPAAGTIPDGHYAFVFAGTAPQGSPAAPNAIAINGTFTVLSGAVQSGFFDENTNSLTTPLVEQPISGGTLTNGADGLGQLVLTIPNGTITFALATPPSVTPGGASAIRIIEFDDTTGAGSRGSGVLKPSLPNPTTSAISGNFAFLFSGTDPNQQEQALVGAFETDGAGNITGGLADSNQAGTLKAFPTVQGTYSVDANGRGVFEVILALGGPTINTHFHYSFYQVSPGEWMAISLDQATSNSPLVSGTVVQQTGGPFTTASLPATSVLQIHGLAPVTGGTTPDITAGFAASDGSGNVTYTFDEYSTTLTSGSFAVAYAVDGTTGRVATTGGTAQPILYIINPTSAFLLGPDGSSSSGMIEAQTSTDFTGDYLGGSLPLVNTSVLNEAGIVAADGAGNLLVTTDRSTQTGLTLYRNLAATYTLDSKGRVVVTVSGDSATRIFYVISPTKIAYLTSDGGGYLGSFEQ